MKPGLIVGDFDSHENPHLDVETIVLPCEKDDTDTVFAVKEAMKRGYTDFLLIDVAEASHEKHIPVVTVEDNIVTVTIGSVEHPMVEEHHIVWVYLQTDRGGQRKCLEVGKAPVVTFALADEKPVAAYAYCNIHGLWKTEI